MKRQHKITPQIDKQIKMLVSELPKMYAVNSSGATIYEPHSKRVGWNELTQKEKDDLINKSIKATGGNAKTDTKDIAKSLSKKSYIKEWKAPREINHYIKLIQSYKEKGEPGIIEYLETIKAQLKK